MTTIGDSFAIVAVLFLLGLTAWAMMLLAALLFSHRTEVAMQEYLTRPARGFGLGLVVLVIWGTGAIVLANMPNPLLKILGVVGFMIPFLVSVIGSAGLCGLIAKRIRDAEPGITPYSAMVKATMLVAVAWFFPFIGWFIVAPVILITSLGIGVRVLRHKPKVVPQGV